MKMFKKTTLYLISIFIFNITYAEKLPDINTLWNFSNTKETRLKFESLVITHKNSVEYVLELKTQIARTLGLEANYIQAHQLLDEIKPLITMAYKKALSRYYLERGRVYNSQKKIDDAIKNFVLAYTILSKDKWFVKNESVRLARIDAKSN